MIVGADGATHAGSFDVTYLAPLPNFVVMAAADEAELVHMTYTAAEYDDGPIAFRYPRGNGVGVDMPERGSVLEIGKGRVLREGSKVALLSFGTRLQDFTTGSWALFKNDDLKIVALNVHPPGGPAAGTGLESSEAGMDRGEGNDG